MGAGTKISNQVQIAHGAQIGKECLVAGGVEIANCVIKDWARIGPASAIKADVTVEEFATVGIGSVVIKSVPKHAKVFGNPARRMGWRCICGRDLEFHDDGYRSCVCGRSYLNSGEDVKEIS